MTAQRFGIHALHLLGLTRIGQSTRIELSHPLGFIESRFDQPRNLINDRQAGSIRLTHNAGCGMLGAGRRNG